MTNSSDTEFPQEFGKSPDDFLKLYERLIYKIIHQNTKEVSGLEPEELFIDFFIHISENNFKRLRQYNGKSQPTTYLGTILRNFIVDQQRKKRTRAKVFVTSIEEMEEEGTFCIASSLSDPEENFISSRESECIDDALKVTFSRLSNREKLIFDLTYGAAGGADENMTIKEISDLLGIKVKYAYKKIAEIKKILNHELKKRGIEVG